MVYGYVRVSTENQRDNWSVDVQRDRIEKFANSIGEQFRIYDEVGSGKDIAARPEFQRLLHAVQQDSYPGKKVWVVEQTRLARNVGDSEYISKLFQKHKVDLYVADRLVDLSSASTRLTYGIQAAVAAHEREQTGERIKRAKKEMMQSGAFVHSTLFGYSHECNPDGSTKWFVNKHEAKVVRLLFKLYIEGHSVHQIAMNLNKLGYKTKRNRLFHATSISKLLNHLEYFGRCYSSDGSIIESKVYKPLLEMPYEAFLEAKMARAPIAKKFKFISSHISGLLTCGDCGKKYYIHQRVLPNGSEYIRLAHQLDQPVDCHQVPKYIEYTRTVERLDAIYKESFADVDFLEFVISRDRDMLPEYETVEKDYLEIKKRHDTLIQQKQNLIEAVAEGMLSKDDIKFKLEALEEEEKKVAYQLYTFSQKLEDLKHEIRTDNRFTQKYLEGYETASIEEKHDKLAGILKSCVINGPTITVMRIDDKVWTWNVGE